MLDALDSLLLLKAKVIKDKGATSLLSPQKYKICIGNVNHLDSDLITSLLEEINENLDYYAKRIVAEGRKSSD
jgi:hypothetical protein